MITLGRPLRPPPPRHRSVNPGRADTTRNPALSLLHSRIPSATFEDDGVTPSDVSLHKLLFY